MAHPRFPLSPCVEAALDVASSFAVSTLETLLPQPAGPEAQLLEAMRALALGQRRRWRAFLVLQSGQLFGVDSRPLERVVAAVECVHAYGRARGGVTKLDDEATAQPVVDPAGLAGDALMAMAFSLLGSGDGIGDPYSRAELMTRLAQRAGHAGLVGGQMLETVFADGTEGVMPPLPEISRLQRMKTAALMAFCCESGALLGHASPPARHALSAYGQDFGLAFQIAGDLAAGASDSAKPTVVSALGAERAHAQVQALTAQAVRHLDLFDEKADLLRAAAGDVERMAGAAA